MAYATHEFKLNQRDKKGVTLREKFEYLEETKGIRISQLHDGPSLPKAGIHIWGWFKELSNRRSGNGFGSNPISFLEVEAWSRLTRIIIWPEEVRILMSLDDAYTNFCQEKQEPQEA